MDDMTESMKQIDMDEKLRFFTEKMATSTSDLLFEIETDEMAKKIYTVYQSYVRAGFTRKQAFRLILQTFDAATR